MPSPTAPLTLNLMTLDGLREGLAMLGVSWKPVVYEHANPPLTNGLYAWATTEGVVLNIGTAWHRDGLGLAMAIPAQIAAAWQDTWGHGHAVALQRLKARGIDVHPYVGGLESADVFDPAWLEVFVGQLGPEFIPKYRTDMLKAAKRLRAEPYEHAERFAVRLSMHLGDTGAPLNHTYKNAWSSGKKALSQALDAVANIVAARLRGELDALPAPPATDAGK